MFEVLKHMLVDPIDEDAEARWALLRHAPRECDRALNGTARNWLRRLPRMQRPTRLCVAFPRVANRIAWGWPDAAASARLLDELLSDRRGGRRGFPPGVVRELRRLREFNARQRVDSGPEGWWSALHRALRRGRR